MSSRKRSNKRSNKQRVMLNYFDKDEEYQSNSKKVQQRSGSISNTQVNKNYRNNSTEKSDHRHSPPILLNFAQHIKETKCYSQTIRDNPYVDICPYKCERDNLYFDLWPSLNCLFCNEPFSGTNGKKWMLQLKKHVEINKGCAIYVAKIACSVGKYWFDYLYNNKKIDVIKYELLNNFHYTGFKIKGKTNKNAPFGSVLVLMQPTQPNKSRKMKIYPKDLRYWKQSMPRNKYKELEFRQKQHMEMDENFFIIDHQDEHIDAKQIKRNCEPETLTQMYRNNVQRNHNVKDDNDIQFDNNETDSDDDENDLEDTNDDISDENDNYSSNESLQENTSEESESEICSTNKCKNGKKRKGNSDYCNGNSPKKRKINHNTNIELNVSSSNDVDSESWDIDSCSSTD